MPQSYLDGVASYDASRKQVNVVFGGDSGTNTVRVNGLAGLGSQVSVRLSSTNTTGRKTNQTAPNLVSTTTYSVVNGSISSRCRTWTRSRLPAADHADDRVPAYQQTYEAENATVVNAARLSSSTASNGGYVGRIDNSGDVRTDSFVDFLVDVPTARSYTMTVRYANGTGATATQGSPTTGARSRR